MKQPVVIFNTSSTSYPQQAVSLIEMSSLAYLHYTLLSVGLYFLNSYIQQRRLPASLPPGPRGLPIIGVSGGFPNRCVTHAWHSTLFSLSSPSFQKNRM